MSVRDIRPLVPQNVPGGYMWDVQAAECDRSRKARARVRASSLRLGRKSRRHVPASLIPDLVGAGLPVALMYGAPYRHR
ncbi:hypothetical protein ACFWWB_14435 [Streptomyces sp. NPDC058690]|uniref:hypothetical protein n=1 Tax=Streptomyces sp. NPDC058690 TaxID=3346600 RepID=UPI0036594CFD